MNDAAWSAEEARPLQRIARNVATRYLLVAAELLVGLITLPFNLRHLGPEAYGLWMLTAGLTIHFSILDLGYGGAMVKFVAQYRASRDARALNEIASTIFTLFTTLGLVAYLDRHRPRLQPRTPVQHHSGAGAARPVDPPHRRGQRRLQLRLRGLRRRLQRLPALRHQQRRRGGDQPAGRGREHRDAAARVRPGGAGRGNDRGQAQRVFHLSPQRLRVFPPLRVRPSLFRRSRLREVTAFSIYASVIDWANKLNYELDEIVIGVFLGAAPVAVWAVAHRIIAATQRLTNQGNAVLFPGRRRFRHQEQRRDGCRPCCSRGRACRSRRSLRSPSSSSSWLSRSSPDGSARRCSGRLR